MQQTSAGGVAEKGGLEFSLANLFKCMCFTHEDPDDSKKQLVNIASSLDTVANRLKTIETRVKGQNSVSFGGGGSFRRQSGRTGSMNRSRLQSSVGIGNPGLLTPDRAGSVLLDEPAVEQGLLLEEDRSSTDSEDSEEETKVKIKRDDTVNPYW